MHILGTHTYKHTHTHTHTYTLIYDHDDASGDDDVGQVSLGEYVVAAKKGRPAKNDYLPARQTQRH